jgi:hypothetical protein
MKSEKRLTKSIKKKFKRRKTRRPLRDKKNTNTKLTLSSKKLKLSALMDYLRTFSMKMKMLLSSRHSLNSERSSKHQRRTSKSTLSIISLR